MKNYFFSWLKILFVIFIILLNFNKSYGEEETNSILQQLEVLQKDIKTLEKAVYSQDTNSSGLKTNLSSEEGDILTKHLLKLSELEEQFKILTNNFEKINFKLDKLSNRITKIQTDNQLRFQDIETNNTNNLNAVASGENNKKKLPGSDEAKDLGGISESDVASLKEVQETQSVESVGTVVTEEATRAEALPPKPLKIATN